ncbi:triple QxxK/R motif-containing protein-like [Penaeus chinensis]|uniref:triple QxxK/R motif-containing protein-like n=1 Tax=Penaeus chinensis TaxID=139456 RepID=UPI001FB7C0BF|nr:triple QxxK/R motif-containing protein-like [Penaeus chinensis]
MTRAPHSNSPERATSPPEGTCQRSQCQEDQVHERGIFCFYRQLEMGRKDVHTHSLPVDKYRKQIGTQYKKKTNVDAKVLKKNTEMKSNSPKLYQDIKIVLSGFAGMVLLSYLLLYLWLVKKVE